MKPKAWKCATMQVLLIAIAGVFSATAVGQQITSQVIGPFTGTFTVFPPSPCSASDTLTFSGSINAVAQVDPSQNTLDIHFNLRDVKALAQMEFT
jgi:glycerol uptake facilitator-like aquaporin